MKCYAHKSKNCTYGLKEKHAHGPQKNGAYGSPGKWYARSSKRHMQFPGEIHSCGPEIMTVINSKKTLPKKPVSEYLIAFPKLYDYNGSR